MNKKELVQLLAKTTGMPQGDVAAVVDGCFKTIADVLCRGERITIRNFGSFSVRKRAARRARNLSNQQIIEVPEHCVVNFEPSENFAKIIRENDTLNALLKSGHDFRFRKPSAKDPPYSS
ncbi:MAG: HU family DNA-binding protein [Bacteroidia bacterium]|nr:integration host factor subunit beta [Bacteroidia bacterium]MDW8332987.1 HU family DNA-binding protein [Bacteroidia bacterium]